MQFEVYLEGKVIVAGVAYQLIILETRVRVPYDLFKYD